MGKKDCDEMKTDLLLRGLKGLKGAPKGVVGAARVASSESSAS